ncbi:MAG: ABC transporter ATP-binding protein [Deltaproteobacteria bacterium]|nr:ABC transporter ATP-binding protein [Deltaproteobacteria bacterium]
MSAQAIVVEAVSKSFAHDWTLKKKEVVHAISFQVARGECFGFVGPNGAGKTTTIKMLLDIIRPSAGAITLLGGRPSDPKVRARVGFLPERPYFYEHLTAEETLTLYARLSGVDDRRRVREMLALVGLDAARDVALRRFSKGMLQRIGLAQALIGDTELAILDEPMSGLDPVGRRHVREIILQQRAAGRTMFFSSHILSDVEAICDRVAMVHEGRIMLTGDVHDLVARAGKNESDVTVRGQGTLPPAMAHFSARPGDHHEGVVGNAALQAALDAAMRAGFAIVSVTPKRGSLEDEFLRGIGESLSALATKEAEAVK